MNKGINISPRFLIFLPLSVFFVKFVMLYHAVPSNFFKSCKSLLKIFVCRQDFF